MKWPDGTVVEIKKRERLGRGIVVKTKFTQGGVMAYVDFPHRDYATWFPTALLVNISVVDMLGIIGEKIDG